jgi:hypothetical protein
MEVIDLPVLPIDAPLREALAEMKRVKCSAVVTPDGDSYWLFKAPWVVWGIARGEEVLGDLEQRRRVHKASESNLANKGIDLSNPFQTVDAIEGLLDTVIRVYLVAALAPSGRIATIITRHENLKYEIESGPADCYCTNPNRPDDPHSYSPPLPTDRKCNLDGSQIVCS